MNRAVLSAWAAAAAVPFLVSCSADSRASGSRSADASTSLAAQSTLTEADRRYFLERTHFGVRDAELACLREQGIDAYLDGMLTFAVDTPVEREAEGQIADPRRPRMNELAQWWLFLMLRSDNPFQERLALFWHDHFATSQSVLQDASRRYFVDHINLLRRMGTGNLRELAYRLAIDPSMLVWLDGVQSTRLKPNENFAREFWEVFTLGRNNGYTEQDIQEAARAFTGYRMVEDRRSGDILFVYEDERHDPTAKTIFGETGEFGYREVVDLTFARRGVAEYACTRLFEYFCYQDPPARVIAELAAILRRNDWELKPVLRTLLRSRAFFSERSRTGRIKTPVEYVVGFMRSTGLELPIAEVYETMLGLRQVPTAPPSVFGWPDDEAWLGSQSMLERGNVLNQVITDRDHQARNGSSITRLLPPPSERTADAVIDALAAGLRVQPTAAEREVYRRYLNTAARLEGENLELEPSPFDGSDPRHLDERVRGLLFLLSQHPSYHTR